MSTELAEVVGLFRDEAFERLDHMVELFLALERGEQAEGAIDALFRDAHTIKGGAGMLGLTDVEQLAHTLEDVLERARTAGSLHTSEIQGLLEIVDRIRAGIEPGEAPELAPVVHVEPAAPAQTVRVAHEKIDRLLDVVGESLLHHRRLDHLTPSTLAIDDELLEGERLLGELKDTAIAMRTLPLSTIVAALPRAVRDIAREQGKAAELEISGAEIELDRVILEALSEPLTHLLRNAVAHGIETPHERAAAGKPRAGRISIHASQRGAFAEVVVGDDGRGVSRELLAAARDGVTLVDLLSRPGFSTAEEAGTLAGRGVGLDAVKAHVEALGGNLDVRSTPGTGTEIVLLLPLALALLETVLFSRGGRTFGVPLASVEEVAAVRDRTVLQNRDVLLLRDEPLPLADVADVVGAEAPALPEHPVALVLAAGPRRRAIACDGLVGTEEVVVKSLRPLLARVQGYLGAAIRGDGTIALLLDPAALTRPSSGRRRREAVLVAQAPLPAQARSTVLVVEDSFTVRALQRSILEAAGYDVVTAQDGRDALDRLAEQPNVSIVVTDAEMPNVDGFELTRAIRSDPRHATLPVVIVTSLDGDAHRQRGLDAGADAYVAKQSFDQRGLLDTIERLVGR